MVAFFAGSVACALGWGPKVPQEIGASLQEALDHLERQNWKSCVVMCRRALQALPNNWENNLSWPIDRRQSVAPILPTAGASTVWLVGPLGFEPRTNGL